jgi:hypothetical protein
MVGIHALTGNKVGNQRKEKACGIGGHVTGVTDQSQRIGYPTEK